MRNSKPTLFVYWGGKWHHGKVVNARHQPCLLASSKWKGKEHNARTQPQRPSCSLPCWLYWPGRNECESLIGLTMAFHSDPAPFLLSAGGIYLQMLEECTYKCWKCVPAEGAISPSRNLGLPLRDRSAQGHGIGWANVVSEGQSLLTSLLPLFSADGCGAQDMANLSSF